jgi:hypothetical protein
LSSDPSRGQLKVFPRVGVCAATDRFGDFPPEALFLSFLLERGQRGTDQARLPRIHQGKIVDEVMPLYL